MILGKGLCLTPGAEVEVTKDTAGSLCGAICYCQASGTSCLLFGSQLEHCIKIDSPSLLYESF